MTDSVTDLIVRYGLMVRPSLTGNWRCGIWKGVDGHIPGRAYCVEETEIERDTLENAVRDCVAQFIGYSDYWVEIDLT